jgi:hypothetical protein
LGLVRERFFTPRLRFKSYDDLYAWLIDKCLAWAKSHPDPEQSQRAIGKSSKRSARSSSNIAVASTGSTS